MLFHANLEWIKYNALLAIMTWKNYFERKAVTVISFWDISIQALVSQFENFNLHAFSLGCYFFKLTLASKIHLTFSSNVFVLNTPFSKTIFAFDKYWMKQSKYIYTKDKNLELFHNKYLEICKTVPWETDIVISTLKE